MKLSDRRKLKDVKPLRPARPGSKRGTGPTTRMLAEKERDLAFIAKELLKGTGYAAIAELMKAEGRTYTVSKDTVYRDVRIILDRWRLMASEAIDEAKGRQLARLSQMELRCLEALERLENGTTHESTAATQEKPGPGKDAKPVRTTVTRRQAQADTTSAWLATWRFCMAERAKILGLYAPIKVDGDGTVPVHVGDNNTVQMVVNIAAGDGPPRRYDFPIHELPDDANRTQPEPA